MICFRAILVAAAIAGLSGCAPLTHQAIKVTSTPEHATVKLNGHKIGTTPMTVQLPRYGSPTLMLTHPGNHLSTNSFQGKIPQPLHAKLQKSQAPTHKQKVRKAKKSKQLKKGIKHKRHCLDLSTVAYQIAGSRAQGSSRQATYKKVRPLSHQYGISKRDYRGLVNLIYINRNLHIAPYKVANVISIKCMHVKVWHPGQ